MTAALSPSKDRSGSIWARILSTQLGHRLLGVQGALGFGWGSPIRPVAPPTRASGRCPASCRRRSVRTCTRWPRCRLGAVGSKPHVVGDRARVEGLAQGVEVGAQRDQAAPLQVVEELGRRGHDDSLPDAPAAAAHRRRGRSRRVGSPASQNRHGWCAPSPDTPTRGPVRTSAGPARPGHHPQRRRLVGRVRPVVRAVDPERHGEPGRAAGQVARGLGAGTPSEGQRFADHHLTGAQQHRGGDALGTADEVHAPVHAVGEVDVDVPGRAEHDGVARGPAAEGVRARVALAVVRLDLGQAHRDDALWRCGARPPRPAGREPPRAPAGRRSRGARVAVPAPGRSAQPAPVAQAACRDAASASSASCSPTRAGAVPP